MDRARHICFWCLGTQNPSQRHRNDLKPALVIDTQTGLGIDPQHLKATNSIFHDYRACTKCLDWLDQRKAIIVAGYTGVQQYAFQAWAAPFRYPTGRFQVRRIIKVRSVLGERAITRRVLTERILWLKAKVS